MHLTESTSSPSPVQPLPAGSGQTVQVVALGVVVDVAGLGGSEAVEFRQAWSRCLAAAGSTAARSVQRRAGSFERANEQLTSDITLAAIEELAGAKMMFHACGLADPATGATIAFIAPSGTGKTTLARTLGTGLGYVSDETIAVGTDLGIVSYPKPLSVKQTVPGLPKLQQGPDAHFLGTTPPAPVLQAITLLSRDSDGAPVSVEDVPLAQAVLELTPQLSALARLDRGLVQLCTMIEACGGVKRIRYSESRDIAPVLPQLARPAVPASNAPWSALETVQGSVAARSGIRRTPVQDAIDADGTLMLLIDSQLIELGPLGALIWEFAADWTSLESILEQVVEIVGPHPAAHALLQSAVDELLASGVLEAA